jgi:hypothetical protein
MCLTICPWADVRLTEVVRTAIANAQARLASSEASLGPPSYAVGRVASSRFLGGWQRSDAALSLRCKLVPFLIDLIFAHAHAGTCGHDRRTAATRCAKVRSL